MPEPRLLLKVCQDCNHEEQIIEKVPASSSLGKYICRHCAGIDCFTLDLGAAAMRAGFKKTEEEKMVRCTRCVNGKRPEGGGRCDVCGHNETEFEQLHREVFETGATRDTCAGKGRPSLISPVLIHRLGVHLAKGAEHYGADNWAKGMPYRRTADSMIRHLFQWLASDDSEDHLAAIAFGVMCLMTYEEAYKGFLPKGSGSLDDRCEDLKKILPSILTTLAAEPTVEKPVEATPQKQESWNECGVCGNLMAPGARRCIMCDHNEGK